MIVYLWLEKVQIDVKEVERAGGVTEARPDLSAYLDADIGRHIGADISAGFAKAATDAA